MSWNRGNSETRRGAAAARKPRVPLVLLVPLVLAVIAAGVWWAVRGRGETARPTAPRHAGGQIAEVTPAAAPRAAEPAAREPTKEEKRLAEIRRYEEKYGTNMPPGIKARVYFLKNPPKTVYTIKNKYAFLRHPAERDIASLMSVEPGTFMLDRMEFGESFNKDFVAALMDKSAPLDDDDDETRETKELVADVMKEIVDVQRRDGRLPNEIMNEHAKFLYDMGQLESDLERELVKARNDPAVSDQDVEDLFVAANRIRKERGLPEWKVPDFSRRSIRLQRKLSRRREAE